jgi:hypothetical protein
MKHDDVLEVLEAIGGHSGAGGSERKLPKVMQILFPEIERVAASSDFINKMVDSFMSVAIGRFVQEFHTITDDKDDACVNMAGFKKTVTKILKDKGGKMDESA